MPPRKNRKSLQELRLQVLYAALPRIARHSWKMSVLLTAARQVGVSSADLSLLFPRGEQDLWRFFCAQADQAMHSVPHEVEDWKNVGIRKKIALVYMRRLSWLTPYKEALRKGLYTMGLPNVPARITQSWQTADRIWCLLDDSSTDFNYYSKRTLLMSVVLVSGVFWLRGATSEETRRFMEEHLSRAMYTGSYFGRILRCATDVPSDFLQKILRLRDRV